MRDLRRAERVELQRRIDFLQPAEKRLIEIDAVARMQAPLQQQLVAAQCAELGDSRKIILERQRIRLLRLIRPAVEIAELASRQADIGIIDVPVDLVTDPPPRHMREPRLLRPLAEFPERRIAIERQSFVFFQPFHHSNCEYRHKKQDSQVRRKDDGKIIIFV